MPQEQAWNELVREVCQALARRDALICRSDRDPESIEACKQRRFWQAQAQAHLRELAGLVERAPQPELARETLAELEDWAAGRPVTEPA